MGTKIRSWLLKNLTQNACHSDVHSVVQQLTLLQVEQDVVEGQQHVIFHLGETRSTIERRYCVSIVLLETKEHSVHRGRNAASALAYYGKEV